MAQSREERLIQKSEYRTRSKDKINAYAAKYRMLNRNVLTQKKTEYRKANPEKTSAAGKRRYLRIKDTPAYKERKRKEKRRFCAKYPDKIRAEKKKWKAENRDKVNGCPSNIRALLTINTNIPKNQIPQGLVEAKRVQLQIKRYLRTCK